jgi:hypothetical protein
MNILLNVRKVNDGSGDLGLDVAIEPTEVIDGVGADREIDWLASHDPTSSSDKRVEGDYSATGTANDKERHFEPQYQRGPKPTL